MLRLQRRLGLGPPVAIILSLLRVGGHTIYHPHHNLSGPQYRIDRTDLALPEVLVEGYNARPEDIMRPIFDAVWNAGGWPRAMSYDGEGGWTRLRP